MNHVELPAFHYFQVGNQYTGHLGEDKRYRLAVDKEEKRLTIQLWNGPYCLEKSEIMDVVEFELTESGFAQAKRWLELHY